MADYHPLPAHVVSKRIKEAMETFPLKGVQFIPAIIYDDNDKPHHDYFIIHVYNQIRCVDLEKSVWKPALTPGNILTYKKLVFNDEILDEIPLNDRLVFALAEASRTIVFHKSVVDKIIYDIDPMPEGFLFCRVDKWTPSTAFENEYYANERGL